MDAIAGSGRNRVVSKHLPGIYILYSTSLYIYIGPIYILYSTYLNIIQPASSVENKRDGTAELV